MSRRNPLWLSAHALTSAWTGQTRAEALASYAKQAGDTTLRQTADRIQARAIRRCGELLRQIRPDRGGRPASEKLGGAPPQVSRSQAARDAGMSRDQKHTASVAV